MSMEYKTASSTTSLSSALSILAVNETTEVPYKIPSNHLASSGANSDITSLTGLTVDLSVAQGGTGASTAAAARTNLGITTPIIYQSAEILTGDTWLDGKPIYRKIVGFINIAYGSNVVVDAILTLSYIDSIANVSGYVKHVGAIYPLGYSSTTPATHCMLYSFTDVGLTLYLGSAFSSTHKGHLVVEYTKA